MGIKGHGPLTIGHSLNTLKMGEHIAYKQHLSLALGMNLHGIAGEWTLRIPSRRAHSTPVIHSFIYLYSVDIFRIIYIGPGPH